ncbi:MAG: hypothetical protein C4311_07310 [Chloroflexota bacterium]
MKKQRITRLLHELAEQEVPADLDLWPAIRAQVRPQARRLHLRPATRLGWAILALGLFLTLGAAAYAVAPVVSRVFQITSGWQHVEETHLAQEVHLSQTIGDWTVTLERVYADANQILVGYTVSGPPEANPNQARVTLRDDQSRSFPEMAGAGVAGASELLGIQLPPGQGAYVSAFDASAIQGQPAKLNLHLEIGLRRLVPVGDAPAMPLPTAPPTSTVVLAPAMQYQEEPLAGPFTFDFSVPFIPGRVALVQESVRVAGVTVRLDRVVVTPSETRAILCFDPPQGKSEHWVPVATLEAGGGLNSDTAVASTGLISGSALERAGCYRYSFLAPLADWQGEWKLTVTELVGMDPTRPGEQTRIQGPWAFTFHVP